jgi:NADPH-dependent 7-cyano-7-deazaguanine reductase QueF
MIVHSDADPGTQVTVVMPVTHLCPFRDEVDNGAITILWVVGGASTFELHALRAYLDSWSDTQVSHEDLTSQVLDFLNSLDGPDVLEVESTWNTAGGEVTVSCST